ncbi:unnamed protein product [Blepharisma stoltei]|uniref:GRIP domain-containing protein n=1 Tax=Blepharisma stoltei TaxID=1481888 RepID=A0AAU9KE79_9CILI|nr:unnamed protein product [Blepharisma stoltei]
MDYDVDERISSIKKSMKKIQMQIIGESSEGSWVSEIKDWNSGSRLSKDDLELSTSKYQDANSGFYTERAAGKSQFKLDNWVSEKPELIDYPLIPELPEKKQISYPYSNGAISFPSKQNKGAEENKEIDVLKKEIFNTKAKIDDLEVMNRELIKKDSIISDLKEELHNSRIDIKELNIKITKLHEELEKRNSKIDEQNELYKKIAELEKASIQFSYEKVELEEVLKDSQQKIKVIENENQKLAKENNDLLSQNKQFQETVEKLKNGTESIKNRVETLLNERVRRKSQEELTLIAKNEMQEKENQDLVAENESLKKYLNEAQQRINELEDQLLETQRKTIKKKKKSPVKINKASQDIIVSNMRKIIGQIMISLRVEHADQIIGACQKVIKEAKITNDSKEFYKSVVFLIIKYSPPNSLSKLPSVKSVLKWLERLIKDYLLLKKIDYVEQTSLETKRSV